jgi:hypothetical protein
MLVLCVEVLIGISLGVQVWMRFCLCVELLIGISLGVELWMRFW